MKTKYLFIFCCTLLFILGISICFFTDYTSYVLVGILIYVGILFISARELGRREARGQALVGKSSLNINTLYIVTDLYKDQTICFRRFDQEKGESFGEFLYITSIYIPRVEIGTKFIVIKKPKFPSSIANIDCDLNFRGVTVLTID